MNSKHHFIVPCFVVSALGAECALAQSTTPAPAAELDFGASISTSYTDNVYATENDKVGDVLTTLSLSGEVSAATDAYEWSLGTEVDVGRFASEGSEDYVDALIRAEGRYNINENVFVFGGIDRAWDHEPRTSPEDLNGIEPTEYVLTSGFAGVAMSFGRTGMRFGANVRSYDFDNGRTGGGGFINNDDRDRTLTELGGRIGYEIAPDRTVFVQGVYDRRDYDLATDDFGYDRDSEGFRLGVGVAGRVGQVTGEAMIGVMSQDYDDPRFETVTAPALDLDMTWRPSTRTRLTASVERNLGETTLFDGDAGVAASGYLSTSAGVRATHWVAGDLTVNGWLWFTENDYQNVSRADYVTEAGFGFRYHLTPHVYAGGGYSYQQRSSDAAGGDYDEHSIVVSLGTELQPLDDGTGPRARPANGGIYGGFNLGYGSLVTAVDGQRGGSGRLTADFGDDGGSAGVFAGYRTEVDGLVVGAEIGAESGNSRWTHAGGRDFSVERTDSISADLLFGFRARNGALLYTRAGVAGTTFATDYARGGMMAERSERELGLRGGVGVEIPVQDGWSARMEYVLAAYPDYDLGVGGQSDNFANLESMVRFGLVYGFGDRTGARQEPAAFDGLYGGVQIGHGVLSSDNVGPRPDGVAPTFVLDVPRASAGAALGSYVGYGWTFGDVYLGVEIDSDLTTSNWNIERDPEGRVVSSDRRGGLGASIRAGYVVNDAFLVYARAGAVTGFFRTDYERGASRIVQDDSLAGWQFGVGVEVPLRDGLHVRFDYTHSEFQSYEVDYAVGIDSLDPEENLFRIGITKRF